MMSWESGTYWYVAVRVPRICGGAVSAWYIGTAALSEPTPNPLTSRPIANCCHEWEVVICMRTPIMKTPHSTLIAYRRPSQSAVLDNRYR